MLLDQTGLCPHPHLIFLSQCMNLIVCQLEFKVAWEMPLLLKYIKLISASNEKMNT